MTKGNHILVKIIAGFCLISLTGCDSREPKVQPSSELTVSEAEIYNPEGVSDDPAGNPIRREPVEYIVKEDVQKRKKNTLKKKFRIPVLPDTGSGLMDFVPEGWTLWDSVELDFNEDKIPDYVGVLDTAVPDTETALDFRVPRILFAIASDGSDQYRLDFQDINLIRTRGEGGVYGDPYEPLTAQGTSFTTHAYGGSAWKWSEDYTYAYYEGVWRRSVSECTYGYGSYVTSYKKDDWERGIGIRKMRSSDFQEMEKYWELEEESEEDRFDVEYEVSLDEPPTIYQAGMRWRLAVKRVPDWSVDSIEFSEGVELSKERVKLPHVAYLGYGDEDCVLYTFQDEDSSLYYLAMYRYEDRKLIILAESDTAIDHYGKPYKGKVYYTTQIVGEIAYRQIQGEEEEIVKEKDTLGICLNRINSDGSGKEIIFEYRYPGTEQEVLEERLPYLSLIYELSGDEIFVEVYIGDEPHPMYRMNSDGSGLRQIGQIPDES